MEKDSPKVSSVDDVGPSSTEAQPGCNEAFIKSIKWKIDRRLCLVVAALYIVNQIDRQNLAYAVVAGMGEEIDLSGSNYLPGQSIIVLLFFPTYAIFQPLMTIVAKKIGARAFLAAITFAWGFVMLGFGLIHRWQELAGLRVLLGLFEAGFFPTCVFLISTWYIRHEVAKRIAFFYLFGNMVGGFGGVLAYGLQQMNGLAGHAGWRWIFIMEGIVTVLFGIVGYFYLIDFPEDAHKSRNFLSTEEVETVINRIEADRSDAHTTDFNLREYLANALDWKVWLMAWNFGATSVVVYAVAYFLPIVLRDNLKFSIVEAQTLNAPCYVLGGLIGFGQSWLSDKYKLRAPFILFDTVLEIVGLALLGFVKSNGVRYFGAFIVVAGANACLPMTLTYQSNNVAGQWRRAFCSALVVGSGGIGGIVASLTFRGQDKPEYLLGLYTCFGAACLTFISVIITTIYFIRQNRLQMEGALVIEGREDFKYTL